MKIDIHRVDKTLPLPEYHTTGSCAFDFIAREIITVKPGKGAFVPGNLIVKVPENYALLILPRSSLFRKKSLLIPNAPGLIDQDYCGEKDEIQIQVLNMSDTAVTIERGERIAQGLFVRANQVEWNDVEKPNGGSRGGFGSTG